MRLAVDTFALCFCLVTIGCQALPSNTANRQHGDHADASFHVAEHQTNPPFLVTGDVNAVETEKANRLVREKLKQRISVAYDEAPTIEVIQDLRKKIGVDVMMHWVDLEAAGLEKTTPITLSLEGVPAQQVLQKLMDVFGLIAEFEPLDRVVRDGMLQIGTERELARKRQLRIYDVRDLLGRIIGLSRDAGYPAADASYTFHFYSELPYLFGPDEADDFSPDEALERMINIIQDTIGRQEDWAAYGGVVGSIQEFDGDLIVKTTPEQHDQLNAFFASLRASRSRAVKNAMEHLREQPRLTNEQFKHLLESIDKKLDAFKAAQEREKEEAVRKAKAQGQQQFN